MRNRKPSAKNPSGIVGVSRHKGGWMARIADKTGRKVYLGYFRSKDEAATARREAEVLYYGAFAPSLCRPLLSCDK